FPGVAPLGREPSDCIFLREGYFDPPALIAIEDRKERVIARFAPEEDLVSDLGSAEPVSWKAPDGLEIHGWLLRPSGDKSKPLPLVLHVHGGPVWFLRPRYLAAHVPIQMLLAAGYAVLEANPRGSSGRGQSFARQVVRDMGGADSKDLLAGLDMLVEKGIADRNRLGVTGLSYGGLMASRLVTPGGR